MATLKEHQAAMVDLLANGSAIPASASRLAHAMHDVLSAILSEPDLITKAVFEAAQLSQDATTPGLNDKALSKPQKALKTDSLAKWPSVAVKPPVSAENRVKELENTIRQLKANNAKLKKDNEWLKGCMSARDDVPKCACLPEYYEQCDVCGPPEQAGCCKEDTQVCEHDWVPSEGRTCSGVLCRKCGAY